MGEIKITLETLYDILRNEKKREDLQKLEITFFLDVVGYIKEKQLLLENRKIDNEIFAAGERDKLEYELRSIKRIIKELYEKREKKIIDITLNKSRTGSDIIDTSAMLNEEKDFYLQLLSNLDKYRRSILFNLTKGELPLFISAGLSNDRENNASSTFTKFEKEKEKETEKEKENEKENGAVPENNVKSTEAYNKDKMDGNKTSNMTKIKFILPMPSFVWKDMKVYGPFDKGDVFEIYPEVAELIVRKGRAEKVS